MLLSWVHLVLCVILAEAAPSPKAKAQRFSPYGNVKYSSSSSASGALTRKKQNAALKSNRQAESFGVSSNQEDTRLIQPEVPQFISNSASQTAALTAEFANEMSSGKINTADTLFGQSGPIMIIPRIYLPSRSANLLSQPFTLRVLSTPQKSGLISNLAKTELTGLPESLAITLDSARNQASSGVTSEQKVANAEVESEVEVLVGNLRTTDSGHEPTKSGHLVDELTSSVSNNPEAQSVSTSTGFLVDTQVQENQGASHISGSAVQGFGSSSNQDAAIVIQPKIVNLISDIMSPITALNTESENEFSSGSLLNSANLISQPFTLQILTDTADIQENGVSSRLVQADPTGVQESFSVSDQQNIKDGLAIQFGRITTGVSPDSASVQTSNQEEISQLTQNIAQIKVAEGGASSDSMTIEKSSAALKSADIQTVANSPESERNIPNQERYERLNVPETAQKALENLITGYSAPRQQSSSSTTSGRLRKAEDIASVKTNLGTEVISIPVDPFAEIRKVEQGPALMAETLTESFGSSSDKGVMIVIEPEIVKTTSSATPHKTAFASKFTNAVESGQLNADATFSDQEIPTNISPLVTLDNMNANLVSKPFTLQVLSHNQGSEGSGMSSRLVEAELLGVEANSNRAIDITAIQETSTVSGLQNIVHAVSIPFSRITLADGTVINRLENNISLDILQIK